MSLRAITQSLIDDHGYSQGSLARELTTRGVKCSQTTIWRILQGKDTTDTVGQAIRILSKEKIESLATG